MKTTVVPSQYLQIALDLATRIAGGELAEGSRIYGRSMMACSTASPGNRRVSSAVADRKVVEVKPQSGAVVLSADSARRYIENFRENADTHVLRGQLKDLLEQYDALNHQVIEVASALVKSQNTFASASGPFPNYEVAVPSDSPLIGKSIAELKFWQSTGGTIVALRRGQTVILSPGPYAELYGGNVIILVGSPNAAEAAHRLVTEKECEP